MRLAAMTALVLIFASGLAAPAVAERDTVKFYNWSGYIAPETIESFQAATGAKITLDTYGEADEAESRLMARGTGYDLAVVSSESVSRLIDAEAIQKIGLSTIPNAASIDQNLQNFFLTSVPQAEGYAVPYLWGTTGVVYDLDAVAERLPNAPLDSWALIFDPKNAEKLAGCGITIVDSVEEVVSAALAYLGRDPNSNSEEDIEAAFAALAAIAPYVRGFDANQYDDLLDRNICAAVAWSSDALVPQLEQDSPRYRYSEPKEGTNLWVDLFVVPSDAGNLEASSRLMDFILRPDMLALTARYTNAFTSLPEASTQSSDPGLGGSPVAKSGIAPDPFYFIKPRGGAEKQELDRRWRMLQIGL